MIRLKADLQRLDAVIRMFSPGYDVKAIRPRARFSKNPAGLKKGAGSQGALDALREAGEPLTTREIARRVLAKRGVVPEGRALAMLASTIHSTFTRRKDGAVKFDASTQPGKWRLAQ
jgi:hypothetical protein